jgi:tetratricopeptide (TPR) repeat protein/NAD-dependent dihydropyrimidine dehydrogenase PreA subunit
VKSGCVSAELKTAGVISRRAGAGVNLTGYNKAGIRKSKTSRWRAAALMALNLFMIAHIIQWRITGKTVSPIEPSETMYTLQNGFVNAGFIFFSLAIIATLIFGRFVCGWGCHILALQDLCGWLLKKMGLHPKPFRSRLLVYVPLIAALYMFVWPVVYRLFTEPHQPLIPRFTNHLVTTNFWQTFPSGAVAIPFLFICGFVTVYFLGQKGFCTYACPYGGFFGLADKFSPGKIRVTPACNQCGHCTATCTSNVLVHAEVKEYGMVVDPGCMKCMDCVSVCPNDALYFGFGKPTLMAPKSNAIKRSYSLSWPEEIVGAAVFLGSFLSVRGVYALVPFLMALGCAAVTTFLTLKLWRLLRAHELSLYRFNLKFSGKMHKAGWAFAAFACGWIGLNAHCGWVRYHEFLGNVAFRKIHLADELALAQVDPARWLNSADRENILQGKKHYLAASRTGLFVNGEMLPKLAWFEYLSGDAEQSVQTLSKAAAYQKDEGKALSLYYRGAILNRLARYDEARAALDGALAERDDLILARQEKGESLWQLGRKAEAVSVWTDAVRRNAHLVLANNELAGAARASGKLDEADLYENQAEQFTPNNPLFHWVLGRRLQDLGMTELAEKHLQQANQLGAAKEMPDER